MLALGMERVGMESSRARRTRSVCVVALGECQCHGDMATWRGGHGQVPEGVAHDQKCDVDLVCVAEDVVAG